MAEPWTPQLSDVGRHIPLRTRDTKTPGSDKMLGTFTANTTPNDAQASQLIDDTVAAILAETGPLPTTGTLADEIQVAARVAVEWRAAADIEVAYRNRDADPQLYAQLDARATVALDVLLQALQQAGAGQVDVLPDWQMPKPPPWGDTSPGSGADYVMGPV